MTSRNAAGFKPATYSLGNRHNDSATASQSTTCDDDTKNLALGLARILEDFPELTRVINSWPTLPQAIRTGILAIVNADKEQE